MEGMLSVLNGLNQIIGQIDNVLWGWVMAFVLLATGIIFSIRMRVPQVRHLKEIFGALKVGGKSEKSEDGKAISGFAALCAAVGGQVGTGSLVGVASALAAGGPGALFWMWVTALVGMATTFSEAVLGQLYHEKGADGNYYGGAHYYMRKGLHSKVRPVAYAVITVVTIGFALTMIQNNSISSALTNVVDVPLIVPGLIVTVLAGIIAFGGAKKITDLASLIVPFMAVIYLIFSITLIILNITEIPAAIVTVVKAAFNPSAVTGGVVGSMIVAMQKGVARGIFSNEAGLGSAPIAAAAAQTKEPVRQGLVSMTGTFIDTIIICTMTGLSIVLTGAWQVEGIEGVQVTTYAFQHGLPFPAKFTAFVLMLCLVFFAFTTILGWDYYSERCLEYLTNGHKKKIIVYRWLYIIAVFIGPYMTVSAVWTIADIFNGLMAIPNMIALFALSGVVAKEAKDFFKAEKHKL